MAFGFCPILTAADGTPPRVLASIKPLHSIAVAVTNGVSEPDLLLDGNISPHLLQVKPSHIRSIRNADVVVWAGDGVERFLPSMVEKQNSKALMISMAEHSDIRHLIRNKHSQHEEHNEEHGELDYHFWLDPQNAIDLVNALAAVLSETDPNNAEQYKSNASAFTHHIGSVAEEVKTVLSEAEGERYLIYHDSLQYLEIAFGLGDAVLIAPQPQVQAGGKRLRALRNTLAEQQVGCLLTEPQFRSPVVDSIAEDLGVQPALIDPLATEFDAGADLYSDWLLDIATTLADCFAATDKL